MAQNKLAKNLQWGILSLFQDLQKLKFFKVFLYNEHS